jgi:hypothetical protein
LKDNLLHKAFDLVFDRVGERTKRALIEDMHHQGIFLNDPELTFSKLKDAIRHAIGGEAAEIVIEQMMIKLEELHEKG